MGESNGAQSAGDVADTNKKSMISRSAYWRVERSWELASKRLDELGMDVLVRIFNEVPEALGMFPFGAGLDDEALPIREKLSKSPAVHAHARLIMREVGNCVSGLNDMELLVPRLRSLGRFHGSFGIQQVHYSLFFKHLLAAVRDALGPEQFDEHTEEAWRIVEASITTVMSQPTALLQAEPLKGWDMAMAAACTYAAVFTPFRLAGLSARVAVLDYFLTMMDIVMAGLLLLELLGTWFMIKFGIRGRRQMQRRGKQMPWLLSSFEKVIKRLKMDQSVTWPMMDATVLMSFFLQNIYHFVYGGIDWNIRVLPYYLLTMTTNTPQQCQRVLLGVHWTHALGLLRLAL